MRVLKFRAWDTERQEMFIPGVLMLHNDEFRIRHYTGDFNDCVIMQSTGLYDDKDQEIYEGDVIAFDVYEGRNADAYMSVVVWGKAAFCTSSYGLLLLSSLPYIKVLGNIYENSELLKENKDEFSKDDCKK